jgi:hypothetical protein
MTLKRIVQNSVYALQECIELLTTSQMNAGHHNPVDMKYNYLSSAQKALHLYPGNYGLSHFIQLYRDVICQSPKFVNSLHLS